MHIGIMEMRRVTLYLLNHVFIYSTPALIPAAILALYSDEDRAFVENLYFEYRELMYMVARKYFGNNPAEIEDAISAAVENMCAYVEKFRAVERNNLRNYVLSTIGNVCRRQITAMNKRRSLTDFSADQNGLDDVPAPDDIYTSVFDHTDAMSLLASFQFLSEREKDLIRMRHIDGMEFAEMAELLSMSEGAVRTALTRAKQRVRKMGKETDVW